MSEDSAETPRRYVGTVIRALVPLALWLAGTLGLHPGIWTTALGALVAVLVSAASIGWGLTQRSYAVALRDAAKRKGSRDLQPYETLWQRLLDQGARLIYEERLTAALAWLERMLGDAGVSDNSWAARHFALPGAPPLWTARSYDRCLLLALIYPVLTILILWAVTGDQGPAEASLQLGANVGPTRRALAMVGLVLGIFCFLRLIRAEIFGGKPITVAFAGAGAFAVAVAGAGAFAGAFARAFAGAGAGAVAGAVVIISIRSRERGWEHWFLLGFTTAGLLACWLAVPMIAGGPNWQVSAPLLLFLGVLTFVNAPFDWLSIGLTRGLLRRGLVQRGWWPYVFALLDAIAATMLIAALAVAMVLAVQAFDDLAVRAGHEPTLPLDDLLRGLREHPGKPKYFWVYATLFSTMIPSLINLCIAGVSLTQGVPWVRQALVARMPEKGKVANADLYRMPFFLTLQWFLGYGLAVIVQLGLFFGLIGVALPAIGFDLLTRCQILAAEDWPGVVIRALLGPGNAAN